MKKRVYVCECFSATKVFACYMNDWFGLLICVKLVILSFIIHQILLWFRGKVPIYYTCYTLKMFICPNIWPVVSNAPVIFK